MALLKVIALADVVDSPCGSQCPQHLHLNLHASQDLPLDGNSNSGGALPVHLGALSGLSGCLEGQTNILVVSRKFLLPSFSQ